MQKSKPKEHVDREKVYMLFFIYRERQNKESRGRTKRAVENTEKVYPYQRTFVFLPHQKEANPS